MDGEAITKKCKLQTETILSDLVDGGKPDRLESDDAASVKSSEREAESDDDDFFDMKCATKENLSEAYLSSPRMQ